MPPTPRKRAANNSSYRPNRRKSRWTTSFLPSGAYCYIHTFAENSTHVEVVVFRVDNKPGQVFAAVDDVLVDLVVPGFPVGVPNGLGVVVASVCEKQRITWNSFPDRVDMVSLSWLQSSRAFLDLFKVLKREYRNGFAPSNEDIRVRCHSERRGAEERHKQRQRGFADAL